MCLSLIEYICSHLSHILLFDVLEKAVPVRAPSLGTSLQPGYEVGLGLFVHQVQCKMQYDGFEICGSSPHLKYTDYKKAEDISDLRQVRRK